MMRQVMMRRAMIAMATRCKKAGLFGLFLWLAVATAAAQPLSLEIDTANAAFDQRTNEPVVEFRMTKVSARQFNELTAKNVGRAMEMRVDGRVIMKPIIREPIMGGSGQIAGGFAVGEAQILAKRLSSGAAKLEVEIVAD